MFTSLLILYIVGINAGMRERSPPLPKISHPSHPVWAIAGFNKAKCNAESPPGGTACLITVSPVPGKLAPTAAHWFIFGFSALTLVVFKVYSCNEAGMREYIRAPPEEVPLFAVHNNYAIYSAWVTWIATAPCCIS